MKLRSVWNRTVALLAVIGWCSSAMADTKFSVVPLGTLGGASSHAMDIDDYGRVVGFSDTADGKVRGFLYTPGQNLAMLGGDAVRDTYAFSFCGQSIMGSMGNENDGFVAVEYDEQGTLNNLGISSYVVPTQPWDIENGVRYRSSVLVEEDNVERHFYFIDARLYELINGVLVPVVVPLNNPQYGQIELIDFVPEWWHLLAYEMGHASGWAELIDVSDLEKYSLPETQGTYPTCAGLHMGMIDQNGMYRYIPDDGIHGAELIPVQEPWNTAQVVSRAILDTDSSCGLMIGYVEMQDSSRKQFVVLSNNEAYEISSLLTDDALSEGWVVEKVMAVNKRGQIAAWARQNGGALQSVVLMLKPDLDYVVADPQDLYNPECIKAGVDSTAILLNSEQVLYWTYRGFDLEGASSGLVGPTLIPDPDQAGEPLSDVKSIACGAYLGLACRNDGKVYSWGLRHAGQLGDKSQIDDFSWVGTPAQVWGYISIAYFNYSFVLNNIDHVAGNLSFVGQAIDSDGHIWAWGQNKENSTAPALLGVNSANLVEYSARSVKESQALSSTPVTGMKDVASDYNRTMALRNDGTVWHWGLDFETGSAIGFPVQVKGPNGNGFLTQVKAIEVGNELYVALKEDGTVWTWGMDTANGTAAGVFSAYPKQVLNEDATGFLTDIMGISAFNGHVLALRRDGALFTWGSYGEYSAGVLPTRVPGVNGEGTLKGIVGFSAGDGFSVVVLADGNVCAWGAFGLDGCFVSAPQVLGITAPVIDASADLDGDGMPDAWESAHGLDATTPDTWVSGLSVSPQGGILTWTAQNAGMSYDIYSCDSLPASGMPAADWVLRQDDLVAASAGSMSWTDTSLESVGQRYYLLSARDGTVTFMSPVVGWIRRSMGATEQYASLGLSFADFDYDTPWYHINQSGTFLPPNFYAGSYQQKIGDQIKVFNPALGAFSLTLRIMNNAGVVSWYQPQGPLWKPVTEANAEYEAGEAVLVQRVDATQPRDQFISGRVSTETAEIALGAGYTFFALPFPVAQTPNEAFSQKFGSGFSPTPETDYTLADCIRFYDYATGQSQYYYYIDPAGEQPLGWYRVENENGQLTIQDCDLVLQPGIGYFYILHASHAAFTWKVESPLAP